MTSGNYVWWNIYFFNQALQSFTNVLFVVGTSFLIGGWITTCPLYEWNTHTHGKRHCFVQCFWAPSTCCAIAEQSLPGTSKTSLGFCSSFSDMKANRRWHGRGRDGPKEKNPSSRSSWDPQHHSTEDPGMLISGPTAGHSPSPAQPHCLFWGHFLGPVLFQTC